MASRTFTEAELHHHYNNGDFFNIEVTEAEKYDVYYEALFTADDNKTYQVFYQEVPEYGDVYFNILDCEEMFLTPIISISEKYTYSPEPHVNVDVPQNMSDEQKNMYIGLLQQALHQIQEN